MAKREAVSALCWESLLEAIQQTFHLIRTISKIQFISLFTFYDNKYQYEKNLYNYECRRLHQVLIFCKDPDIAGNLFIISLFCLHSL